MMASNGLLEMCINIHAQTAIKANKKDRFSGTINKNTDDKLMTNWHSIPNRKSY